MALAALFAALALFWISTRQFPTPWRFVFWLTGAVLLLWTAYCQTTRPDQFGLWQAIGDTFAHTENWREAAIVRALLLNAPTVTSFIGQLFDFFLVASALLGALALSAFTRGEALERALRPAILALLGFVAGSVATLAVVAIGFGGYVKPRSFTGHVEASKVHDGDTFWIGENSLRLYGADAPESDQTCRGLEHADCGAAALAHLAIRLAEGPVQCDQMLSRKSGRPRDTFGRALVRCWLTTRDGVRLDLAEDLIRSGYAVQYEGDDYGYSNAQAEAAASRSGLLSGCTLRPDMWRNNDAAREAFVSGQRLPAGVATIGNCQAPPTPP